MESRLGAKAGISACETSRRWALALEVFDSCQAARVEETLVLYNTAISSCEKGSYWQLAVQLIAELQGNTFRPSIITFNAAMSACSKGSQWRSAILLFAQAQNSSAHGTLVTYCEAMAALAAGAQWHAAFDFLASLNRSPYHSLVAACKAVTACEAAPCPYLRLSLYDLELRLYSFLQNCCASRFAHTVVLDCTALFVRRCVKFLVRLSLVHRPLRFICASWLMIFNYCKLIIKARLVFLLSPHILSVHLSRCVKDLRTVLSASSLSYLCSWTLCSWLFLMAAFAAASCSRFLTEVSRKSFTQLHKKVAQRERQPHWTTVES